MPAMLVSGRALALLSERDTSSCGHCSEKGATVSKAAPPIIPSIPSFFTIGLRLQRHIPRHKGTNVPFEMCLPPNDAPNLLGGGAIFIAGKIKPGQEVAGYDRGRAPEDLVTSGNWMAPQWVSRWLEG